MESAAHQQPIDRMRRPPERENASPGGLAAQARTDNLLDMEDRQTSRPDRRALGRGWIAAGGLALLVAGCAPGGPARPGLGADHPLAGRIYQIASGRFVDQAALVADLAARRFRAARRAPRQSRPPAARGARWSRRCRPRATRPRALAFEMIPSDRQLALVEYRQRHPGDAAGLGRAVGWARLGWPDWALYAPIAESRASAGAEIVAADLSPAQKRAVFRDGPWRAADSMVRRTGLDQELPANLAASLARGAARRPLRRGAGGGGGRHVPRAAGARCDDGRSPGDRRRPGGRRADRRQRPRPHRPRRALVSRPHAAAGQDRERRPARGARRDRERAAGPAVRLRLVHARGSATTSPAPSRSRRCAGWNARCAAEAEQRAGQPAGAAASPRAGGGAGSARCSRSAAPGPRTPGRRPPGRRCWRRNRAPSAGRPGRPRSAGRPPPPCAAWSPSPASSLQTPWCSQLAMCWLEMRSVARSSISPTSLMSGTLEQPTPWSIQRTT